MIPKLWVWFPAGGSGDFSSPELTFCADSSCQWSCVRGCCYFSLFSTHLDHFYPQETRWTLLVHFCRGDLPLKEWITQNFSAEVSISLLLLLAKLRVKCAFYLAFLLFTWCHLPVNHVCIQTEAKPIGQSDFCVQNECLQMCQNMRQCGSASSRNVKAAFLECKTLPWECDTLHSLPFRCVREGLGMVSDCFMPSWLHVWFWIHIYYYYRPG